MVNVAKVNEARFEADVGAVDAITKFKQVFLSFRVGTILSAGP